MLRRQRANFSRAGNSASGRRSSPEIPAGPEARRFGPRRSTSLLAIAAILARVELLARGVTREGLGP